MLDLFCCQVASFIQSGHELVLTEMIFNGDFNSMNVEQLLAACSCFVCQEKAPPGFKVNRCEEKACVCRIRDYGTLNMYVYMYMLLSNQRISLCHAL